ncbi:proteasome component [Streptomyces azureus]|uniref:Proteasome component n=1 Tax=Streptomyces azureus TaxID=146537 RepID=A0A0K8PGX0_STRAJ|nr:proteasome component [Streptomyces azureus]
MKHAATKPTDHVAADNGDKVHDHKEYEDGEGLLPVGAHPGSMTVRRVMGIETEYGISVPGHPNANPMLTSSQIVNAYAAAIHRARRDFEEENPLRDARGFDIAREAASQFTDEA